MDTLTFAREMFEEYQTRLYGYLDGLTTEELNWRPDPQSNSIAFIVWHTTRVEDRWFQTFCQDIPDLWSSERWFDRMGMDVDQPAVGLTTADLAAFPALTMEQLKAYFEDVRAATERYLKAIGSEDLRSTPGRSPFPGSASADLFATFSIRRMFRQLIQEEMQHLGQLGMLRGLQRGLGK